MMIRVNFRNLAQPVRIIRAFAVVIVCATFSLASTHILTPDLNYWAWCMFTWTFCFVVTILILLVELSSIDTNVPTWDDLSAGFAILQGLMCLSAAMIFSIISADEVNSRLTAAAVLSWLVFLLYVVEVVLTQLRPRGETSGFFSTVAGIMKIVEMVLACLIFASLGNQDSYTPELSWCVAVYSLCFIFALLIVVLTLTRLAARLPINFDQMTVGYNALAAIIYITAAVLWPLTTCKENGCDNKQVAVTALTVLNCLVYILDTAYSIFIVFFAKDSSSPPSPPSPPN